jgi:hypothetical protein
MKLIVNIIYTMPLMDSNLLLMSGIYKKHILRSVYMFLLVVLIIVVKSCEASLFNLSV